MISRASPSSASSLAPSSSGSTSRSRKAGTSAGRSKRSRCAARRRRTAVLSPTRLSRRIRSRRTIPASPIPKRQAWRSPAPILLRSPAASSIPFSRPRRICLANPRSIRAGQRSSSRSTRPSYRCPESRPAIASRGRTPPTFRSRSTRRWRLAGDPPRQPRRGRAAPQELGLAPHRRQYRAGQPHRLRLEAAKARPVTPDYTSRAMRPYCSTEEPTDA